MEGGRGGETIEAAVAAGARCWVRNEIIPSFSAYLTSCNSETDTIDSADEFRVTAIQLGSFIFIINDRKSQLCMPQMHRF